MSTTEPTASDASAGADFVAEPGKLYRWDGTKFAELTQEREKGSDRRVPITEEALTLALALRAQVQKKVRMRPDLSIVVSAIVEHAAAQPDIVDVVADYGLKVYAANKEAKAAAKLAAKSAQQEAH